MVAAAAVAKEEAGRRREREVANAKESVWLVLMTLRTRKPVTFKLTLTHFKTTITRL